MEKWLKRLEPMVGRFGLAFSSFVSFRTLFACKQPPAQYFFVIHWPESSGRNFLSDSFQQTKDLFQKHWRNLVYADSLQLVCLVFWPIGFVFKPLPMEG